MLLLFLWLLTLLVILLLLSLLLSLLLLLVLVVIVVVVVVVVNRYVFGESRALLHTLALFLFGSYFETTTVKPYVRNRYALAGVPKLEQAISCQSTRHAITQFVRERTWSDSGWTFEHEGCIWIDIFVTPMHAAIHHPSSHPSIYLSIYLSVCLSLSNYSFGGRGVAGQAARDAAAVSVWTTNMYIYIYIYI